MVALDAEAKALDAEAKLYDSAKLTAPIKRIQDKYELLPAFLKVQQTLACVVLTVCTCSIFRKQPHLVCLLCLKW